MEQSSDTNEITLLDQSIEDRFFRAVLVYPKLLEITLDLLNENNFSTKAKAMIWRGICFYYSEFRETPSIDLLKITIEELYTRERAGLALRVLDRIGKLPVPAWKWILAKIDEYIKIICLQKALFESAHYLKEGKLQQAADNLVATLRNYGVQSGKTNNDLDLSRSDIFELVENSDTFCCPTRIYALDEFLRGLFRKELFLIMAPMNVGKSWAVVHMATAALLSSRYVLYFTLEMNRERVLQRIFQNVSGTYSPRFDDDLEKVIQVWAKDWQEKEDKQVKSLLNLDRVYKNLSILKKFKGLLSIKEYPSGTATINDLNKDIALYDVTFGKLPDVVIVDGILDLKHGGSLDHNRQRLGVAHVTRELRRLASEYDCAVVATHQGNRESIGADIVGMQHVSESIGIGQIADTGISLNQTKAEYQLGKMRINIMKSRNQQKWGVIDIWQNLEIGQFCQVSKPHKPSKEKEDANNSEIVIKRKKVKKQ